MASDKLMNHTQGETIIGKLTAIADSLDDLAAVTPAKLGMGIATCDTPGSTVAKTAALANFALVEGAPVSVQFTYANTAANATLNINNTGAKPIIYKDAAIGNDVISAGDTCTFIYTTNTYKITNIDTLTGPGSGTVRQVGAENGLITDQSDNADIQTTGKIGLNLKSDTAFSTEAPDPVEIEDKLYPVALDAAGHPAVSVPGTEYTQGAGINISENNVITNTGVFDVTAPTSSDTTATNGDIKVIKKVVNNGVTTESVEFVKPKGINDPAFKALDSSTSGLTSDDNHVPTSKTVQDAIDTALASASIYKGTISAFNDLPTSTPTDTVRKGWYYRVSTAWSAATGTPATHVGDIIIAEKDSPSKAIDSANWSLLHNEANTDANVTQSPVSTNANYEVLFSGSADNTSHTEGTGKDSGLTYNPFTNKLTVSGEVSASSYSGLPEGNTTTKGIVQLGTDADKAASGSHVHGNITNGGAITETGVDLASGDALVFADYSDSSKLKKTSIAFDGATDTQALTRKGTWVTFNNYTHPTTAGNKHIPANGATGNYLKYGGSSGTAAWVAPLTTWPATAQHTDTLPSTKLIDDRFKTNETNILYSLNTGVKNVLPIKFPDRTVYRVTLINNNDGSIRVNGTNSQSSGTILLANIQSDIYTDGYSDLSNFLGKNKDYVLVGNTTTANLKIQVLGWNSSSDNSIIASSSTDAVSFNTSTWNYIAIRLWAAASAAFSNVTITPMICTADAWAQSHDYQPPALPNYDLTRLEAEDRAALAEEIDAGAKNIISGNWYNSSGDPNLTFTANSDGSLTISKSAATSAAVFISAENISMTSAQYVCSLVTANSNIVLQLRDSSGNTTYGLSTSNTPFTIPNTSNKYKPMIRIDASATFSNVTVKPMLCTKAAFGVSQKFVPYRPNYDLVCSDVDTLKTKSSVAGGTSNKTCFEVSMASYSSTGRGAFLISFTSQTRTYIPALYYVVVAEGRFGEAVSLVSNTNVVTAVTVSSDNTKLYFTVIGNTWAAPVILPLIDASCNMKFSTRWLDSIPN